MLFAIWSATKPFLDSKVVPGSPQNGHCRCKFYVPCDEKPKLEKLLGFSAPVDASLVKSHLDKKGLSKQKTIPN